jgi:hypothetical protein
LRENPEILAADANALRQVLLQWGKTAPDRLNRRGRKTEVEKWIMARWLKFRLESDDLSFPLTVWRNENPDFYVQTGSRNIGLEITEAVDPEEQVAWTHSAKEDLRDGTDHVHDIDQRWVDGKRFAQMVRSAVDRKITKCSADCTELLVYLNTTDDMCEKLSTREHKLGEVLRFQERFHCVWVLSGEYMMSFPRIAGAALDNFERATVKPREVEF